MRSYKSLCFGSIALGFAIGFLANRELAESRLLPAAAAQSAAASAEPRSLWGDATDIQLTPDELANIHVYETANRSVVNIDTKTPVQIDFFGMYREAEGTGSGAVVDKQGHIITNYHVVDGARQIKVTLASNEQFEATLVGGDREQDIAVLKIDAPQGLLFPIAIGSSDTLRVGQRVYALGNPFGWDGTMSMGIVSSLNRNLPSRVRGRTMQSLIQTDAAMNPGNSGGPLLDTSGRMVGMCVAIAGTARQNSGVGFAIPVNRVRAMLPELIEHGRIVRADIGIYRVIESDSGDGLVIMYLDPEGPAAKAGLRGFRRVVQRRQQGGVVYRRAYTDGSQADRIIALNGEPVKTGMGFLDKIWQYRPGDVVTLTIMREGETMDVDIRLGSD